MLKPFNRNTKTDDRTNGQRFDRFHNAIAVYREAEAIDWDTFRDMLTDACHYYHGTQSGGMHAEDFFAQFGAAWENFVRETNSTTIEDQAPDDLNAFEWDAQPVPMVCLTNASRYDFERALRKQESESRPDAVETTLRDLGFFAVVGYKHARPTEPPPISEVIQQPENITAEDPEFPGAKELADRSPEMLAIVRALAKKPNADDLETLIERAGLLEGDLNSTALTVAQKRLVSR